MGGSFKIGRFSGIDVRVHWTFLLLLAFFAFLGYRNSGTLAGALTPIAVIVALFVCVLLHEFGHSLVAQRLGFEVQSITLLPIGGVSNLETLPEKPSDEVKITLAGPLVNVVLAPIFFGAGLLLGAEHTLAFRKRRTCADESSVAYVFGPGLLQGPGLNSRQRRI